MEIFEEKTSPTSETKKRKKEKKNFAAFGGGIKNYPTPTSMPPPEYQMVRPLCRKPKSKTEIPNDPV